VKTTLTALLLAFASLAFVSEAGAQAPSFKKRPGTEKEFMTEVGEAVVKAVRSSPAKLAMADDKITEPEKNRKLITITMNWAGSLTGTKFKSEIKLKVVADKPEWEVSDIEYSDDNPLLAAGKAEKLKALKEKFNR
jgi:hypothetical protein